MKTAYKLTQSELTIENEKFVTYGIAGDKVSFGDVSTDKSKVERILKEANDAELEECHLIEFIEDCII